MRHRVDDLYEGHDSLDDADRRLMPFAGSESCVGGVNGGFLE